jgi:hypothetical protein
MTDEIDIIKVIKRRQANFQDQLRHGPKEQMDQVARLIAEEYDALLAEIEAVRSKSRDSKAERDNETAEAEILGDLGQSGG